MSNTANFVQIGGPIVALAWWATGSARSRSTEPVHGAADRLLHLLALKPPVRGHERFVDEVLANMVGLRWGQRERLVGMVLAIGGAICSSSRSPWLVRSNR